MVGHVSRSKPSTYKGTKRKLDDKDELPSKVIVITNPTNISRDKFSNVLYNKQENKQYRVVYGKMAEIKNLVGETEEKIQKIKTILE
ncbi:hypothetical protein ACF0H5_024296 [Mactra antiquata]